MIVINQDKTKISAMYLWLPLYLNDHLGYPPLTAGLLSTSFDIGGVFGGPILGCLSDSRGTTLSWVFKASLCVCFSLAIITMFNPKNVLILGMFVSDCYSHVFILSSLNHHSIIEFSFIWFRAMSNADWIWQLWVRFNFNWTCIYQFG